MFGVPESGFGEPSWPGAAQVCAWSDDANAASANALAAHRRRRMNNFMLCILPEWGECNAEKSPFWRTFTGFVGAPSHHRKGQFKAGYKCVFDPVTDAPGARHAEPGAGVP